MSAVITGVWSRSELADAGLARRDVDAALKAGRLRRLRRGWYQEPTGNPLVVRAVASGGVLTCGAALALHGAWSPPHQAAHVRCARGGASFKGGGAIELCPARVRELPAPSSAVDSIPVALLHARRCLDGEDFVAVVDSLVHVRAMSMDEVRALFNGRRARELLDRCDRAESGTESLVRQRLWRRGVHVRPQVWFEGVGRVDLLVGERLVIEVDSVAHHTGVDHYRADRARDLRLRAMGYIVVRLTYEQVMFEWPATEQSLLAMIRRGDQWWGSRKLRRGGGPPS